MTGYQEILTDPSYNEQIITMTYPLIGNYGTNNTDTESRKVFAAGFIVKENCPYPSNWRNKNSRGEYLRKNNVVGLEGIDTRKLVKHIRTEGAMKGIISSTDLNINKLKEKLRRYPGLVGRDIVKDATAGKTYNWNRGVVDAITGEELKCKKKYKVVAFDFGIKHNILRLLCSHGCRVKVVPADASAKQVLRLKPDGVFLSTRTAAPAPVSYAIN